METTILIQPYSDFMKEAMSFCETACGKYQIPVLFISTRRPASEVLASLLGIAILTDPAPTGESLFSAIKHDLEMKSTGKRIKALSDSGLYFFDKESINADELDALDVKDAQLVFIDDSSKVPATELLEEWACRKGIKVIVRKDA